MNEIKEETKDSKNHEKLNAQSLKILKRVWKIKNTHKNL